MAELKAMMLEIAQPDDPIRSKELAQWLFYFRLAYGVGSTVLRGYTAEELLADEEHVRALLREHVSGLNLDQLEGLYLSPPMGDLELFIDEIIYASNPKIKTRTKMLWALIAAAILSGGTVDLPGARIELPPLGEGIERLIDAFDRDRDSREKFVDEELAAERPAVSEEDEEEYEAEES